ncbi:hypothetical protein M8J77_005006 [Diaphorina citri]|nr:hypothetical protein M8J77_005006 [Diaphorina citri]
MYLNPAGQKGDKADTPATSSNKTPSKPTPVSPNSDPEQATNSAEKDINFMTYCLNSERTLAYLSGSKGKTPNKNKSPGKKPSPAKGKRVCGVKKHLGGKRHTARPTIKARPISELKPTRSSEAKGLVKLESEIRAQRGMLAGGENENASGDKQSEPDNEMSCTDFVEVNMNETAVRPDDSNKKEENNTRSPAVEANAKAKKENANCSNSETEGGSLAGTKTKIETPKAKSTPATPKKGSKKKSPRKGKRKHPSKSPSGQKAPGDPRKRGIANANSELLGIPMLEFGWCREIVYRRSADSNFADVYYHSPQPHSKKFRSKCQIGIELQKPELAARFPTLTEDHFTFSRVSLGLGTPYELERYAIKRSKDKAEKSSPGTSTRWIDGLGGSRSENTPPVRSENSPLLENSSPLRSENSSLTVADYPMISPLWGAKNASGSTEFEKVIRHSEWIGNLTYE